VAFQQVQQEREEAEAMAGKAAMNVSEELRDTAPQITTTPAEGKLDHFFLAI
jgi:hypothetical protein